MRWLFFIGYLLGRIQITKGYTEVVRNLWRLGKPFLFLCFLLLYIKLLINCHIICPELYMLVSFYHLYYCLTVSFQQMTIFQMGKLLKFFSSCKLTNLDFILLKVCQFSIFIAIFSILLISIEYPHSVCIFCFLHWRNLYSTKSMFHWGHQHERLSLVF